MAIEGLNLAQFVCFGSQWVQWHYNSSLMHIHFKVKCIACPANLMTFLCLGLCNILLTFR